MRLGSGTDISPTVIKQVAYILCISLCLGTQDEIEAKSTGLKKKKRVQAFPHLKTYLSTQDCMLENTHVSLEEQKARNNQNVHQLKSD